ncbi:YncE family protein [Pokkaliibacter sp. MBI-7]|uniref:YncE family protein n=1 Tax=Pokkaliibacter sp. MBI-7 TaxID=3040600 RepID=UPI00244C80F9|nr:YncE family protein [Pokkaliibacter sp. MBI-7]MDH2431483.1 YncE family protein [Pokkaliibacter sp. MBI-7]
MFRSLTSPVLILLYILLSPAAQAAVSSSAFVLRNHQLFSANYEAGSVSKIDEQTGALQAEVALGKDIRSVALSDDDAALVLATDYVDDKVFLLSTNKLAVKQVIEVGHRPYAAVFDSVNKLFWVTLFEDHKLLAIDTAGQIVATTDTADTPRGLALLDDGRLLVSHAMTGEVSIYQTRQQKPGQLTLLKRIHLQETANPDETVSQGVPRLLDNIAISPEGDEAWLPHVLWNFDHSFQFQSTVFPAISVLDLTPGEEEEKQDERKQLFQQINLLTAANRSEIVSNPYQAVFSADGNKVYVTLAGSEDLLVFDRSRRGPINKKRHRSSGSHGGARATQLLRHLPGENPRGIVIDGDTLFVQNAQSLDVSRLNAGGGGTFARATVSDDHFALLVTKDAAAPDLRRGIRFFNLGNTFANKDYPMAGDNWMSCQSCHLDGFNFTNKYLQQAHAMAPADNALTGHENMMHMVSGDFLSEYIRMVQLTQGGFGADDRDGARPVDPTQPPAEVKTMMEQLHRYVIAPYNLPTLASWLRLQGEQVPHPQEWLNSASCQACHSDIFKQWSNSNHRLMGQSNPYYTAVLRLAEKSEGKEFGQWCQSCHMPQAVLSGVKELPTESHMLEKDGVSLIKAYAEGHPVVEEGTSCLLCHRITRVEDAGGNASFTVNLDQRQSYLFEASDNAFARWIGERMINAKPDAHIASYQKDFYKDAVYCKACHDEFAPGTGANIVNTWEEWSKSHYATSSDPAEQRSCISCHMNANPGNGGAPVPGQATLNGTQKANVFTHDFTGAQMHLAGMRDPHLAEMSVALLKSAATISASMMPGELVVRVTNSGAGHAFPTGVSDFRQFWLAVKVWDATGQLVYQSGQPDAEGELPEDTRLFQKVFGDKDGKPVGLHFWRYAKLLKDTRIPADSYRDEQFALPAGLTGAVRVEVRLQFRTYPQWITAAARSVEPALTDPPVVTLHALDQSMMAMPTAPSVSMSPDSGAVAQ